MAYNVDREGTVWEALLQNTTLTIPSSLDSAWSLFLDLCDGSDIIQNIKTIFMNLSNKS